MRDDLYVRTNLTLSKTLRDRLHKTDINWSAVAEAALWRALEDTSMESQMVKLQQENDVLRRKVEQIRKVLEV